MCFVWLLADGFRFYFTGSSTLLFTFPSRYSFTIGLIWYLVLECGHPGFRREFAVSQPTQESFIVLLDFAYGIITLFDRSFQSVLLSSKIECWGPTTPGINSGFGLVPFRSSLTQGISYVFFSSAYLDISVRRVTHLNFKFRATMLSHSVIAQFGHGWIITFSQLPNHFRGVSVLHRPDKPRHPLSALIHIIFYV